MITRGTNIDKIQPGDRILSAYDGVVFVNTIVQGGDIINMITTGKSGNPRKEWFFKNQVVNKVIG